jgi:uncharacterized membrane protein HdeD (DUF308 family)
MKCSIFHSRNVKAILMSLIILGLFSGFALSDQKKGNQKFISLMLIVAGFSGVWTRIQVLSQYSKEGWSLMMIIW